jgi:dTDP-4-dehydrorhamnose 3,5-epimerase
MNNSEASAALPFIIRPKRFVDNRGWFSETYNEKRLMEIGIHHPFVQDNQSFSTRAGTLRGLHFQVPPVAQAKLVTVLQGRILDVVVDVRHGSPTFGRHVSVILSPDNGDQFYVPSGFAHGFLALEDNTVVSYKVSHPYAPALEGGLRWDDPDLAIAWLADERDLVISEKDRELPLVAEFRSPFAYQGQSLIPPTLIKL